MTLIGYIDFRERKREQGPAAAFYSPVRRRMQCTQTQEQQTVVRRLLG